MRDGFDEWADVVVLGSGAAGCAAALTAGQSGLEVVQLEKTMVLGGTTAHSYGFIWVPSAGEAGPSADGAELEDAVRYLRFVSGGGVSEEEARHYCTQVVEALGFLARNGVELEALPDVPDHYHPSAPGSRGGGRIIAAALFDAHRLGELQPALGISKYVPRGLTWTEVAARGGLGSAEAWDPSLWPDGRSEGDYRGFGMSLAGFLLRSALDNGVDLRLGHQATRLIVQDGRVAGCEVAVSTGDGAAPRLVTIGARRGVVIATGGIEGNPELVLRFEDLPDWQSHFPEGVTGDGMVMASEVGAGLRRNRNNLRPMMGYRVPPHDGAPSVFRGAGIEEMAAPRTVVVNRLGRRFADESRFQHVVNAVREFDVARHEHRNYPCYLLMDSEFFRGASFAGRPHGAAPPDWLPRGDDLASLAGQLGIDPQGLAEQLAEFNADAHEGVDHRFDRGTAPFSRILGRRSSAANPNLGPLETPPFYGLPLVPTGIASTTLSTDSNGRVLTLRGQPLEGLYACGNAAPNIDRGPGYQAGVSLGQGIATGCAIGWGLAQEAPLQRVDNR